MDGYIINNSINKRIECGFLILISLLVYSPVFYSNLYGLDDMSIVRAFSDDTGFDFVKNFFSGRTDRFHRPVMALSFYLDSKIFGMIPTPLHLTNLLIHMFNGYLVYTISEQWLSLTDQEESRVPFLVSALFLFHPVNAESVCWYAGRSDLLAGLFVLLSFHYLLRFFQSRMKLLLAGVVIFAVLGIYTKEVVYGYIPVILMLWWYLANTSSGKKGVQNGPCFSVKRRQVLIPLLAGLCCVILLVFVRQLILGGLGPHLEKLFALILHDPILAGNRALAAFGFYLKKILLPWPLNYAIFEVSNFFIVVGLFGVAGIIYSLLKPSKMKVLYLCGCFVLATAIPLAIVKIAWTPLAERYLYVSLIFFLPALLLAFAPLAKKSSISPKLLTLLIGMVLLVFTVTTNLRAYTWSDPKLLYADTVAKSPGFSQARIHYAKALIDDSQFVEAERQLKIGMNLASSDDMAMFELYFGFMHEVQNDFDEAVVHYEKGYQLGSEGKKREALKFLIRTQSKRVSQAEGTETQPEMQRTMLGYYRNYYSLTKDPHLLYRMGQVALSLGDNPLALENFQNAIELLPAGSPYVNWAKKIMINISANVSK